MKKKVFSFVLIIAMLAMFVPSSLVGTTVFAGDRDFVIEDNVLTDYKGSGGDVVIPNSVTSIGDYAFQYCESLTSVTIPDSVTSIGDDAFYYCRSLTSITIPNSVTSIGRSAFSNCNSLKKITIPNSVTSIGNYAFYYCRSLTSITLSNSINSIGYGTFSECSSLTSVTIPNSVTSIDDGAFAGCSSLTSIDVSQDNQNYSSANGVLYDKSKKLLIACPGGKSGNFSMPNSVTEISNIAFYDCKNLTSITIPNSVVSIGMEAFAGCDSIKTVTIPDSVTDLGESVFKDCSTLENATVGKGVTYLGGTFSGCISLKAVSLSNGLEIISPGDYDHGRLGDSIGYTGAFADCKSLKQIYIPKSVTYICLGDDEPSYLRSFDGCSSLEKVEIDGENQNYYSIDGVVFETESNELLYYPEGKKDTSYSIPEGNIKAFIENPFLTEIRIPSTYEGNFSFDDCSNLQKITVDKNNQLYASDNNVVYNKDKTKLIFIPMKAKSGAFSIPDSVTTIGAYVFWNHTDLTSMIIPNSVTSIGTGAFSGCTGLTSMIIPNSVTSIGYGAFRRCENLRDIYYAGTEQQWNALLINEYGDEINLGLNDNVTIHYNYVPTALSITSHPANVTAKVNDNVSFSVQAQGDGLTYQWYYKKAGQTAWNKWGARTTATTTATANATWNGMQVYCKVTDQYGNSVDSNPATITIKQDLKITAQPTDKTIKLGDNLTLSVKAEGIGLTYQWYYKKSGQTSFSTWNGRTHASETCTPNATWNGIQLYCVVKDSAGKSVQSNTVKITVTQDLKITTQPVNQTIKLGNALTLSLKAEGSGLTYQWYFKKSGQSAFSKWNGRTHASETVTPNESWNGIQLYCVVKDSAGKSVQSNTIKVTFSDAVTIVTQPANVTVKTGADVKFTVKAEGVGLTYQWYYKKATASDWSKWSGRTAASTTATSNTSWDGMLVRCIVKNSSGKSVTSNAAKITLSDVLAITQQPTNVTTQAGKNVTFTVKAKGAGLTYQWYYKKAGTSDWSKWGARTTASTTATANATWNGMQVRCVVKDSTGKTVTSSAATITIK